MSYTYEEGLEVWKSCTTLEDYDNLIANTSVKVQSADANSGCLRYRGNDRCLAVFRNAKHSPLE